MIRICNTQELLIHTVPTDFIITIRINLIIAKPTCQQLGLYYDVTVEKKLFISGQNYVLLLMY